MSRISPSKYYNNYDHAPRQKMIEDLLMHSIKQYGVMLKYIPRENFNRDELFGEDPYTKFELAVDIEAYPREVDGFGGQGDMFSKFGLEIKDSITFTIAMKKWDQIRSEKLVGEDGFNLLLEDTVPGRAREANYFQLETGTAQGYSIISEKPQPGDLIYFPMVDKVLEILHIEDENLFYQHGTKMTWDLSCELFDYSHEEFVTGEIEIDKIDDLLSLDRLKDKFLMESGDVMVQENGDPFILDGETEIIDKDNSSFNSGFQAEVDDLIVWSEKSPFTTKDKW